MKKEDENEMMRKRRRMLYNYEMMKKVSFWTS